MTAPRWVPDEDAPVPTEVLDTDHGRVCLTVPGDDAVLSVSILFHDPALARATGEELAALMLSADAASRRRRMS